MKRTPKCSVCNKDYPILPWERLPAMVGFKTEKDTVNVCRRCLMTVGAMTDEERTKFFEEKGY